ncbi:hypothetical protein [Bacillus siamensis]|uniref:hypothetical protein n=1 Tax=Bacillus siamensis TaxID=659243 RepID=UPI00113FDA53|nr:hypothetical protein [Bacillus siamensis]
MKLSLVTFRIMPRLIWHIVGGDFDADTLQTVAYFKSLPTIGKKKLWISAERSFLCRRRADYVEKA